MKSTFILLGLGLVAGLAAAQWRDWRALMPGLGAAVGGVALALTPLVARNLSVGAPPLALASGGTVTFISHNARDYDARVRTRAEFGSFHASMHVARIMGESQGQFLPAALATLQTHTPSSYFRQLGHKFAGVWHWYEVPNNANFYLYRMYARILYLPATFFVIGPLGAIGLLLGLRQRRKCWPLYVLLLAALLPLLAFMTGSRLRLPFVAGLIPFAALTMVRVISWIHAARHLPAIWALGGILLAAALIDRPLPKGTPFLRYDDCQVAYDIYYHPRIQQALADGDLARATQEYTGALEYEPDFVRSIGRTRFPASLAEAMIANFYALRFRECSMLLARAGQAEAAQAYFRRAEELGATLQQFRSPPP